MVIDKTKTTEQIAVTLWEHRVDYNNTLGQYTLSLVNDSTKAETIYTVTDISNYPARYNLFELSNEDMEALAIGWHTYTFSDEDGALESNRVYVKGVAEIQYTYYEN